MIYLWYLNFIPCNNMLEHLCFGKEEKLYHLYICMMLIYLLLYDLISRYEFGYWILITYILMITIWNFIEKPCIWHETLKRVYKLEFVNEDVSKMGSLRAFLIKKPKVHLDEYIVMAMWYLCNRAIRGRREVIRLVGIYVLVVI